VVDKARLNVGLAVHLFGWRLIRREAGDYFEVPDGHGGYITVSEPHDWAGTWPGMGEVVTAMAAKGWQWSVEPHALTRSRVFVSFWHVAPGRRLSRVQSRYPNDVLEATAMTALRAVAPDVAAELEAAS